MIRRVKTIGKKHFADPFLQGVADAIHLARYDSPHRPHTPADDRYMAGYNYARASAHGLPVCDIATAAATAPGADQYPVTGQLDLLRRQVDNNPWSHARRR